MCPQGFRQSDVGQIACDSCPLGKFDNSTHCQSCAPGQYQDVLGAQTCKPCLAGTFALEFERSAPCQACGVGKYQLQTGQTECTSCAAGKFGIEGGSASACESCPDGWYQPFAANTRCFDCEGGRTCSQVSRGNACPQGKYLPALTWGSTCLQCEAEHASNGQGSGCESCPSGKTTKGARGTPCIDCPLEGWNGITSWNGLEFQTQEWPEPATRTYTKPDYRTEPCSLTCSSDSSCPGVNKCFDRGHNEFIPGCEHGMNSRPGYKENRCYKPYTQTKPYTNRGTDSEDLGECEGHCTDDTDCEQGLYCHRRGDGESTPGCDGGQMPDDYNVCFDPAGETSMAAGFEYVSVGFGYCQSDIRHLLEANYPSLLSQNRRLYDSDRVQECMNRCMQAYPGTKYFMIRTSDQRCACVTQSSTCYWAQSPDYFTYEIVETTQYVQTFETHVVALTTGNRQYNFFDVDDYARLDTWQEGSSGGNYDLVPFQSTTIEQMWSKGMSGRIKITCANAADLYNCHFKVSKNGQTSELKFYQSDPGSTYCALQNE